MEVNGGATWCLALTPFVLLQTIKPFLPASVWNIWWHIVGSSLPSSPHSTLNPRAVALITGLKNSYLGFLFCYFILN